MKVAAMETTTVHIDEHTHVVLLSRETVESMLFRIRQEERSERRSDVARELRSFVSYLSRSLSIRGDWIEIRHNRRQLLAMCQAVGDHRITMEIGEQIGGTN